MLLYKDKPKFDKFVLVGGWSSTGKTFLKDVLLSNDNICGFPGDVFLFPVTEVDISKMSAPKHNKVVSLLNEKYVECSKGESVFIDKTPQYIVLAKHMKKIFPNSKHIFLIRHPIVCWQKHMLGEWPFDKRFPTFEIFINLYLQWYQAAGDEGLWVRFEEMKEDLGSVVSKCYEFIDVPSAAIPLVAYGTDRGRIEDDDYNWFDRFNEDFQPYEEEVNRLGYSFKEPWYV